MRANQHGRASRAIELLVNDYLVGGTGKDGRDYDNKAEMDAVVGTNEPREQDEQGANALMRAVPPKTAEPQQTALSKSKPEPGSCNTGLEMTSKRAVGCRPS